MVRQRALVLPAALYEAPRGGRDLNPDTGEPDPSAREEPVALPPA